MGTVLDAATGAVVRTITAPSGQSVIRAALYPDGHRAVVFRYTGPPPYTKPGELVLWDIDAGRELKKLDDVPFGSLTVSPDGRWLMTQNHRERDETWSQSELIVWDAATWEPVLTRKNPPVFGSCAMFTKDSKSVVVGTKDGVAVLEIPSGQELKTFGPLSSHPEAVAVSADGRWIAAAPGAGRQVRWTAVAVHLWDTATGAEVQVIPQTAGEGIWALSFSPDGRRLASAGYDAKVKVWDTETGQELLTLAGHKSWIWKMQFSPDGNRILSCGRDRTLRIWDGSPLWGRCIPNETEGEKIGSVCRRKRGAALTVDSMSCPIGLGQYSYWPDCYGDTVVAFCKSEANEPIRAVLQAAELHVSLLGSTPFWRPRVAER